MGIADGDKMSGTSKSKSTQPRSETCYVTLYLEHDALCFKGEELYKYVSLESFVCLYFPSYFFPAGLCYHCPLVVLNY